MGRVRQTRELLLEQRLLKLVPLAWEIVIVCARDHIGDVLTTTFHPNPIFIEEWLRSIRHPDTADGASRFHRGTGKITMRFLLPHALDSGRIVTMERRRIRDAARKKKTKE